MAVHTTEKCRLVTRSDFDGLVCAALLERARDPRRDQVRPPQGHAGRARRDHRSRHHDQPPYVPGVRLAFDHHESETAAPGRDRREPHHRSRRAVGRARRVRLLRRRRALHPGHRAADGGRRQGRQRAVLARRDHDADRLDPAQLPDGPAHRARPLPRLSHLQLPADDGADRRLPGAAASRRCWRCPTWSSA